MWLNWELKEENYGDMTSQFWFVWWAKKIASSIISMEPAKKIGRLHCIFVWAPYNLKGPHLRETGDQ